MEMLDFKIVIAKSLAYNIHFATHQSLTHLAEKSFPDVSLHLPVIQTTRDKCRYCYNAGIKNKTYTQSNTYGVLLCLVSGSNSRYSFANFHTQV